MVEPIKVLIVDDSAFNRRSIAQALAGTPEVKVVGTAADGEEALRLVGALKPNVITLDLEMPKMDGFTFLRILMSKMPTPVIVVSSYSQKENVFRALELGALDFIPKPDRHVDVEMLGVRDLLLQKVLMVRALRPEAFAARRMLETVSSHRIDTKRTEAPKIPPRHLVAIASSTGGPTALMEIFGRLPPKRSVSVLVAQHMPEKFTRTFAERLNRRCHLRVTEAQDLDVVSEQTAFVCPGRKVMQVESEGVMSSVCLRVRFPDSTDRYVPSADRLLASAAKVAGSRCVGVILTGMGDDGVEGAKAIRAVGGRVIAESEETAVVYGMPGSAVRAGVVNEVMPLPAIADWLAELGA